MKQKFRLRTISPVHIGTGEEFVSDLDYTISGDDTILLDSNKLCSRFVNDPNFLNAITDNSVGVYLHSLNVDPEEFAIERIEGKADGKTLRKQISTVSGQPYIPGSSIKGSIRTALFQTALKNNEEHFKELSDQKKLKYLESDMFAPAPLNGEQIRQNPNNDIGRLIRIADVTFENELVVVNSLIMNKRYDKTLIWKDLQSRSNFENPNKTTGVSVVCIKSEITSRPFTCSIDSFLLTKLKWKFLSVNNWLEVAKIVNTSSTSLMANDNAYINHFDKTDETVELQRFFDRNVKRELEKAAESVASGFPSFVLNVGWGGGWSTKTGFTDKSQISAIRKQNKLGKTEVPDFPKTRKVAQELDYELSTMGWVVFEPVQ